MGGNMPNIQLYENNLNNGQPSTCTCTCGDMFYGPQIACVNPQTCVEYCLQMYSGRCTLVNTYGCCGSSCQYFQVQSLQTRYCTCNCADQQFVNPTDTCISSQACLIQCRVKYPQVCMTITTQACCGQDCQSYSQAVADACSCQCQGNTYYPSPKCSNPEECINTCMTTYGTCIIGQTQGCCGASCSSYVPTCTCNCDQNFTTITSVPCQNSQTCLETCISSYGACTQDNTQACCGVDCLNSFQSCSCLCSTNQYIPLGISCGSPQQCVQACLQRVAQCNIANTQGCCGSNCLSYIPTCRCQCGIGIYYTTSTCISAEHCANTCISQFGYVCTPTNTLGCCNGTLCTRQNRFLGVSKASTLRLSYVTILSSIDIQQRKVSTMKLIFLLSTIWLITTTTWAYSNDCAKGPEYWCRDISTAEECGAMRHCQQNVWREKENTKNSMTKSETAHMLCNVLVQATTELLTDGSIDVNSIKQYLRNDCTKLPDQNNIIHQCQMAVDLYLSDILRHIQSGTKAEKICPIIQGHDSQSVFIPTPKPIGLTPNQTCVLCEFIVYMIQTFAAANSTAQELTKILENICQIMPDVLKNECKSFVDTYGFDIIVLILRDVDSNKTCALIKLCPKPTNVAFLIKPNANTCGLCDYVSTYLSAGYPIENVCTAFSTNNYIKQQCEVLVHLYKPNYCSQLPICYEDVVIQPIEQSIETTINSVPCSLCQYVISYVDTVIQNNKTEAAIEAALEKVCSILPGALKDKCVQFVDTYGPVLLQLIEKYGTPDKVCNALKLCHNGTQEITP
ncbi:unnamed protein product, partial [Rotaria sordida]